MVKKNRILLRIRDLVRNVEPNAKVILYGSYARGQNNKYSDIDILILVDSDDVTYSDEQKIKDPLYDLEFETGMIISPLVLTLKDWENKHSITPFYHNIVKEGVSL